MKERLAHSFGGFLRAMQMSRSSLFVFVEDMAPSRYFYGEIIGPVCRENGTQYEIVCADELGTQARGKEGLLEFFHFLEDRGSLKDHFQGKTSLSLFFLDKDIDDYQEAMIDSESVVYTEYYEVENYLFIYGNLRQSIASTCSLTYDNVNAHMGDPRKWRSNAALLWKEWTELCFFAHKTRNGMQGYSRNTSPINNGIYGPVDEKQLESRLVQLQSQNRMASNEFRKYYRESVAIVGELYDAGRHDVVFKGKWYYQFICEDARNMAGRRRYMSSSMKERLASTLAQSVDYTASWSTRFRDPIEKLII